MYLRADYTGETRETNHPSGIHASVPKRKTDTFSLHGSCQEFKHSRRRIVTKVLWHHLQWWELGLHPVPPQPHTWIYRWPRVYMVYRSSFHGEQNQGQKNSLPVLGGYDLKMVPENIFSTQWSSPICRRCPEAYLIRQALDFFQCSTLFLHQNLLLRAVICRLWKHNVGLDASGRMLWFGHPFLYQVRDKSLWEWATYSSMWRGTHSGNASRARQSIHLSHSCLVRLHNPGSTEGLPWLKGDSELNCCCN